MTKAQATTVDKDEISRFTAMAEEWWDPTGKFKPLHKFNPVRLEFLRDRICQHFERDTKSFSPFSSCHPGEGQDPSCQISTAGKMDPRLRGDDKEESRDDKLEKQLTLLDIGCGGGLLSEPMARLGAKVTGIDAGEKNIKIAALHAAQSGLEIDYCHTTVETLAETGAQFDIILNMEVIEHVANVSLFLESSCQLLKPGGLMVVATLNRTLKSYALAIVGAEYVLRWLPTGTHDWNKFLRPSEIAAALPPSVKLTELVGVTYNPLLDSWKTGDDLSVNYMGVVIKS